MGSSAKAPPPPDYTGLAEQSAASQAEAAQKQTVANRPNQTDIYGNTSTWSQADDGSWSQKQSLNPQDQALMDQQQQARARLLSQQLANTEQPFDPSGAQAFTGIDESKLQSTMDPADLREGVRAQGDIGAAGDFNMDPMGNSKAIQDATYALSAPQREQARNSEIQRLKNQGLTEDSPAFQRAVQRLDTGDTDAQLKALIAGQSEYGNQFQRAMGQNQQNFGQRSTAANFANASGDQRFQQNLLQQKQAAALRGQQVGEQADIGNFNMQLRDRQLAEQEYMRNMPAQDLETLMSMPAYNKPEFGQFMSATGTSGTDYSGAAQKTYDAQMGDVNAKNATRQGNIQGGVAIAGTVAAMF